MAAMLIFLNSHFYHITPQLETLQSVVPHCPLTLLQVDHFFLNAFIVLNHNITITTFLFSFIMLSSAPAWRAIFSFSCTSYLLDFSDCSTVSHLKVKNNRREIHAVDGVRGELCSYCSLHWISCARFQVKEGVQGERTLGNLCIIEVSPWDSSSFRNSSLLSLSCPR